MELASQTRAQAVHQQSMIIRRRRPASATVAVTVVVIRDSTELASATRVSPAADNTSDLRLGQKTAVFSSSNSFFSFHYRSP